MKKLLVLLTMAILLVGCAQAGPYMVDPGVYRSSRDLAIAKNDAKSEVLYSEQLDEQLNRQRALQKQKGLLGQREETIDLAVPSNSSDFPVIFINNSSYNKTFIAKKERGIDKNVRWMYDLKNKNSPHNQSYKETSLDPGFYTAQWVVEGYSTIYPKSGPDSFRVWDRPIFFYEKTGKWYYGFYFLYD